MAEAEKKENKKEEYRFGQERANLYERYADANKVEEKQPEPEPEKEPEKETVTPPAEGEQEKEEKPPEPEKPAVEEKKMVPLDALHSEREKRKSAQARIKELETQVATLLRDVQYRKEEKPQDEAVEDYEKEILVARKEIKSLKEEVASLKADYSKQQQVGEAERQTKRRAEVNALIEKTDKELTDEGFPLFKRMQHAVSEEILKRINAEPDPDDRELLIRDLDSPEGWKKIYREAIFPDLEKFKSAEVKKESKEKKIEAKKNAQLSGGSGAATPAKEEEKAEWTYDDYLKERRKTTLGGIK